MAFWGISMISEDVLCVEKLQKPVKLIFQQENSIKKDQKNEEFSDGMKFWKITKNIVMENAGHFCKIWIIVFKVNLIQTLLILAISFIDNGDSFAPANRFSDIERVTYQKITQYNIFESRTTDSIKKKIELQNDETLTHRYDDYQNMKEWVDITLRDERIDEHLRYYLNKKWADYCRDIDTAFNKHHNWINRIQKYRTQQDYASKVKLGEKEEALKQQQQIFEDSRRKQQEEADQVRVDQDARKKALDEEQEQIVKIRERWNKVKDSSSRFVPVADAKHYELNFIERTGLKLGKVSNQIGIGGRIFIVDKISHGSKYSHEKSISQITRQLTPNEKQNIPKNRYFAAKLVEKKLLGSKGRYTFLALFFARPEKYAEFGFDTEPLTKADINPVLEDILLEAKRIDETFFLCIASPTGFEPGLNTFSDSDGFHKQFISQDLSVCYLDLETGMVFSNPHDELATSFRPFCEMEIELEKIEKIKLITYPIIDDQLSTRGYVEYNLVLKECKKISGITDESFFKKGFYQYGSEKGLQVKYIQDVGLVIMKKKTE